MDEVRESSLLCRVGGLLCAIPLEHVEETMRPLPTRSVAGAPVFIQGLAVVRGVPMPVVDGARLLCGLPAEAGRFVSVKTGTRRVVLAVEKVVGISRIPPAFLTTLPPLLRDATPDAVASMAALDAELLVVVRAARLVPNDVWPLLQLEGAAA